MTNARRFQVSSARRDREQRRAEEIGCTAPFFRWLVHRMRTSGEFGY